MAIAACSVVILRDLKLATVRSNLIDAACDIFDIDQSMGAVESF
jgi:hypothetical protein